jgi:hypothetical protein
MNITITNPSLTAQNCKACHAYATYSATKNTPTLRWSYSHAPNGVTGKSTPGCKVCH